MDEQCFIGCAVSSRGEVLDAYPLDPESFYDPHLRKVYRAVHALHKNGQPISTETVMSKLGLGSTYLIGQHSIFDLCHYPSVSMAPGFHRAITNWHSLRKTRHMAERLVGEVEAITLHDNAEDFCRGVVTESATLLPNSACENLLGAACDELSVRLDALERGEHVTGLKTPLACWNDVFGGLVPGGLYALAARPGLGKTALMEQMVGMLLMDEMPVLVFEKDMSPRVLIERMACRFARVPHWKLSKSILSATDISEIRRFVVALKSSALLLYSPVGLSAEQMGAITRREVRTNGVRAVFLDHIQCLNVGKDFREGLTNASLAIRRTTTETNVPHIILAHINRNGAKGRPSPEDIKEFDQLFGDCDGMAIVWTDADRTKLKAGELLPKKMYFAKNRNGPVTEEEVLFDGNSMSFKNAADQ